MSDAPSTSVALPPTPFFRRAVGLELRTSICAHGATVEFATRSDDAPAVGTLSLTDAALLCRLNRWQTTDESNASPETLRLLCENDLVYYARTRPLQDLSASNLTALAGPIALRRNVTAHPVVEIEGSPQRLPYMPRRGELTGATLVGFDLGVHEMGEQTYAVTLVCCEPHARALRDLFPLLTGEHTAEALLKRAGVDEILPLLFQLGLLESRAHTPAEVPRRGARVSWYAHAAVLFEDGGSRVFADPLFHACSVPERPGADMPPDPRDVGPVDAVLITHPDNDHLNPRSLLWFATETPVFCPRPREEQPYQVDTDALFALLGFNDVRSLDDWQSARVGALTVTAAPFRGEDWGLVLAGSTYVVAGPGATIYLDADSEFMPDVCERIGRDHRVDLALLGISGCEEASMSPPGFGYGGMYAPWIDRARRNEWLRLTSGPDEAAQAAVLLGAQRVFGYAAGGASFMTMAFSDRGTHAQLADALAQRGHGQRAVQLPLGLPYALTVGR